EKLEPVPALADLNRVQPEVHITGIEPRSGDTVAVTVEVAAVTEPPSRDEGRSAREVKTVQKTTGVYDLRLFRSGQLVGQRPEPKAETEESLKNGVALTAEQLQAWREARRVEVDRVTGKAKKTFVVRLPHGQAGKEMEF